MFRKVSVFVLVIAFHVLVLGVVYLSTREPSERPPEESVETDSTEAATANSTERSVSDEESVNTTQTANNKPPDKLVVHVVEKGDYLGKIAAKYKVSSKDIMTLNNISNPNKIQLGQKIKIPAK